MHRMIRLTVIDADGKCPLIFIGINGAILGKCCQNMAITSG